MIRKFPLMVVGGLLAACAGTAPPPVAVTAAAPAADPDFGIEIGTLPAQRLTAGACGLFLWSRTSQRRLVFFSESGTSAPIARMMLDGRQSPLTRTAADGEMQGPATVRQSFDAEGRRIDLEFLVEPRPGLLDGAVVPRGTLSLGDGAGRQMVLPVSGLIACGGG